MQYFGQFVSEKELSAVSAGEFLDVLHELIGKDTTEHWYDEHYRDVFGMDILSEPFDFDKKYQRFQHVWKNKHIESIFLRLDDISQWVEILQPFFPKLKGFPCANSHNGKGDVYEQKYEEFLGAMRYTHQEIESIRKDEYFTHFYTREEQTAFVERARGGAQDRDFVFEDASDEDSRERIAQIC